MPRSVGLSLLFVLAIALVACGTRGPIALGRARVATSEARLIRSGLQARPARGITGEQAGFDAASVLLGLTLAWLALLGSVHRSLGRLLCHAPAHLSPGDDVVAMGLWGGRARALGVMPRPRGRLRDMLPFLISAGGVWLICAEPADFLALRPISIYLGFAVLGAALTLMHGGGTWTARWGRATQLLGRMLVLSIVIACACALSGTKALDGIVAEQGIWPSQWSGFRNPALIVCVPLYVVFAGAFGTATLALPGCSRAEQGNGAPLLARLLDEVVILERVATNVALCSLAVVLFAGGWRAPALPACSARLLGAVLFVSKAWGVAALLQVARRNDLAKRLRMRVVATTCAASVGFTTLWLGLEPAQTRLLSRHFGIAFATAAFTSLAIVSARRASRRRAVGPSRVVEASTLTG